MGRKEEREGMTKVRRGGKREGNVELGKKEKRKVGMRGKNEVGI